jgi:hypothetical protein
MTKANAEPAILIVAAESRMQSWLGRVMRSLSVPVASAVRLDGADLDSPSLVVAAYDGLDDRDRERLLTLADDRGGGGPALLVVLAANDYQALFGDLAKHHITNVIDHHGMDASADLIVTAQKLLRGDIFGIDKYFGWGIEVRTMQVHRSADTNLVVDGTVALANQLAIHPRLVANIATVAEELVTNAVYNAPVDAAGKPRFAHLPRTSQVELDEGEDVSLSLCCDGQTFGIAVTDPFGALAPDLSLVHLVESFRSRQVKPDSSKGGAGLGLFMCFDSLNHMVLNLCHKACTEVIGLIDVRGDYRDFVRRGKSFNVFKCSRTPQ